MKVNRVEQGGTQGGNFDNCDMQNTTFNIHNSIRKSFVRHKARVSVACSSKQFWVVIGILFVFLAIGVGTWIYLSSTASYETFTNTTTVTPTKPPGET